MPRHIALIASMLVLTGQVIAAEKTIRAGMIGLDTSHVPAFAKIFNAPNATGDVSGIKIFAAYPGGTDVEASRTRVAGYTKDLRGMGIEIVDTIPALLEKVDVVLLESVDGRIHLKEAAPVIKAGKRLFIDKPLAGSLADSVAIYDLAKKHNVPCFSSSSVRFYPAVRELKTNSAAGAIAGASTWGPCSYQDGIPDMFYYGIHGIDMLYALMGPGCETVSRAQAADVDVVVGTWQDGRIGTYRGIRKNKAEFGATLFGSKAILHSGKGGGYEDLCREIGKFFKTGQAPVALDETLEVMAFMEAADESKRQGGRPVSLKSLIEKARAAGAP
jgi:predicted dehydrogenase